MMMDERVFLHFVDFMLKIIIFISLYYSNKYSNKLKSTFECTHNRTASLQSDGFVLNWIFMNLIKFFVSSIKVYF